MGKVAVTGVAAAYQYTVSTFLERFQDKHRADSSGTGKANDAHVWWIFQPACTCKISASVGAVSADKSNNFWFKKFIHQRISVATFSLLMIKMLLVTGPLLLQKSVFL
jgi:hypothetical protein